MWKVFAVLGSCDADTRITECLSLILDSWIDLEVLIFIISILNKKGQYLALGQLLIRKDQTKIKHTTQTVLHTAGCFSFVCH